MNRLEERYRRVLRLLPASYRRDWEDDMVATFLESAEPENVEEAEFAAEYGRPRWSEVASVVALAVRLRLGGVGAPPRYLAWGETIRRVALVGLLVHAVTAVVSAGWRLWSLASFPDVVAPDPAWALLGLVWVAAYVSLVIGRWRMAQLLAALGLAQAGYFFGADLAASGGAYLLSRAAELLVNVVLVLALAAFHRQAVPVRPRPWLVALPVGATLLTAVLLLVHISENQVLMDWPSLLCAAVVAAAVAYLAVPRAGWRSVSWSAALALLALTALGLRAVTLLDYLQFAVRSADLDRMITAGIVETAAVLAIAAPLTIIAARALHATEPAAATRPRRGTSER